ARHVLPGNVVGRGHVAGAAWLPPSSGPGVLGPEVVPGAPRKGLFGLAGALRHVLRNTYIPLLTVLGLVFANLMVGTAVVEYVFSWPGIGRLAVDSALLRDQPVVVGFTVAAGLIFTFMNLLVDVGIAALDPRIRSL